MMKKQREQSLARYFLQYVKLMFCLFAVFVIFYSIFSYLSEKQKAENNLEFNTQTTTSYLYTTLGSTSQMIHQLSGNTAIQKIVNSPMTVQPYDYVLALKALEQQVDANNTIASIYLYQKNTEIVLTSGYGKVKLDGFYDADFLKSIKIGSTAAILPHTLKETQMATLVARYMAGDSGNETFLCINFDLRQIKSVLIKMIDPKHSLQIDVMETPVLTVGTNEVSENLDQYFIRTLDLGQYNVSVSTLLPQKLFYQDFLASFLKSCGAFLLLLLLVSGVLMLLIRSLSKILLPMVRQLNRVYYAKESQKKFTLEDLKSNFSRLVTERQNFYNQLDESRWLVHEKIVLDLLLGNTTDEWEFKELCKTVGIELLHENYLVGSVQVYGVEKPLTDEEQIFSKMLVKNHLMKLDAKKVTIQAAVENEDSIGFFLNYLEEDSNEDMLTLILDRLKGISDSLSSEPNLSYFCSMIAPVDAIAQIPIAYQQAKSNQMHRYFLLNQNYIVDSLSAYSSDIPMTSFDTKKILFAAEAGELEFCKEYIQRLVADYQNDATPAHFDLLKSRALILSGLLLNRVYVSAEENVWHSMFYNMERLLHAENEQVILLSLIKMTEDFSKHKLTHLAQSKQGNQYIQKIQQFMELNYDKEISVTAIAEHLSLNAKYLSRLFKRETGETLSQYLANLRMEKAVSLLEQGDLSVRAISEQLGFNDPRSFTRLFKKCYGINPMDYRKGKN